MRYRATAKKLTLCIRACICVPPPPLSRSRVRGDTRAETHADNLVFPSRRLVTRSVLRRRDDKGAGNSLFVPGTMSVPARRLGLILNETSLRRAYIKRFAIRLSRHTRPVNKWKPLTPVAV